MKFSLCLLACLLLGCAGSDDTLVVKQFQLRDQETNGGDPMVNHEKLRRLYGAVSMEERRSRLGQYYTILWDDPETAGQAGELLFEYQQGGSGSRIKVMRREIAAGEAAGKHEFSVIGDDYFDNGRVIAWKISLLRDGRPVAERKSYLWD